MRPLFESMERREFFSTAVVAQAAHSAAQMLVSTAQIRVTVAPVAPKAWNDLAGNWTGTWSNNLSQSGTISASFQNRQGMSNTGTFNLSGMIGQSGLLTTTTPDAYGNVLVTLPVKGGVVCFVAGLSRDGNVITGRWCSHVGTAFAEGMFTMHRV
jgi:hypothetical protein